MTAQAGDILRGGATSATGRKAADARANAGAQAAEIARAKAADRLARTTKIITDMRQMQAAARAAGSSLTVPDGLAAGGLVRLPGGKWTGANAPVQSGRNVNIKQTASQALLDWKTFNVGKNTTLNFDQTAGGNDSGKWIAFNKVFDPSGVPSKILGKINADGQVYIINQNGIIFGSGSQVNARTLVASSLPINDRLVEQGLLNNRDAQFLFSSLYVPGGSDGTQAFNPAIAPYFIATSGSTGTVVVEKGATLSTPANADGNGGRVMLVGSNVRNDGAISSPSGQVILAAGLQVGVQAHDSTDPSLRGLDVWVGAVSNGTGNSAGTVINAGLIDVPTGSALLTGRNLVQNGIIDSTTSVNLNGRIDLRASYGAVSNPNFNTSDTAPFVNQYTGSVRFGEGSATRILPDYASDRSIPGTSLPERSRVEIEAGLVSFDRNSILQSPNAAVAIRAGLWAYKDTNADRTTLDAAGIDEGGLLSHFLAGKQQFFFGDGTVQLGSGALIDVAGSTDVFVALSQRLLEVELRGSELADSSLQRKGALRGVPLTVDVRKSGVFGGRYWVGTPLGDVTGLVGLIESNVSQLTTEGGTVTIGAGRSILVDSDAMIDVSGGYFRNQEGMVRTTRLSYGSGLIDISQATPDRVYGSIYTGETYREHAKWGVRQTFRLPLAITGAHFEKSYISGADGGDIEFTAPTASISGELLGTIIESARQRSDRPEQSRLSITFEAQRIYTAALPNVRLIRYSPSAPTVIISAGDSGNGIDTASENTFRISPEILSRQGFGHLTISSPDGNVIVPSGQPITIAPGGSLSLAGANIRIGSDITAAGGTLSFKAFALSPSAVEEFNILQTTLEPDPRPSLGRGSFRLDSGIRLDAAGLLVDDRTENPSALTLPLVRDGGSVVIESFTAELSPGSEIDVSGGVAVSPKGKVTYGKGGSISILTGRDLSLTSVTGGGLSLSATLKGYSGTKGGTLSLRAPLIQIGGTASGGNIFVLDAGFFQRGGFSKYSLTGIGAASIGRDPNGGADVYPPAVLVSPGTQIHPMGETLVASLFPGGETGLHLRPELRQVGKRAPASIELSAIGADDDFTLDILEARGDVLVGQGSEIVTDPGASISLSGGTVTVLGSLIAPGGSISIKGRHSFPLAREVENTTSSALPTVFIGPAAKLSAAGTSVVIPDGFGRRRGTVYDGGIISVFGNIVAAHGSVMDVSGTSQTLDLHPQELGRTRDTRASYAPGLTSVPWGRIAIPIRVDSDGGVLELEGAQMLLVDSVLLGSAGGPTAVGGILSVHSGRFYPRSGGSISGLVRSTDTNLWVTQSGSALSGTSATAIGQPVRDSLGRALTSTDASGTYIPGARFSIDQFSDGGFDSLELGAKYLESSPTSSVAYGGNIEFLGPVSIVAPGTVRLAGGGVIRAESQIFVSAKYITLGQPARQPLHPSDAEIVFQESQPGLGIQNYGFAPTPGPGNLVILASFVDVGHLSLQSISSASISSSGDIRGSGTLAIAGDLTIEATQLYPSTLSTFNLVAYDHGSVQSSITIRSTTRASTPYSAGGSLGVYASHIVQAGTLSAPMGSIALGWDGTTDLDKSTNAIDGPFDPVSRNTVAIPVAQTLQLAAGSLTSVSAIDSETGNPLLLPYGLSPDGSSWIDPRGVNITTSGIPEKSVTLSALGISTSAGSTIDIRGGGDLYAYRWTPGIGGSADRLGTASREWEAGTEYSAGDVVLYDGREWTARVASTSKTPDSSIYWAVLDNSFAIVPGYSASYAPLNAYNTRSSGSLLQSDPGYVFKSDTGSDRVMTSLASAKRKKAAYSVGDQITISGSTELPEGTYTLLPRRYALYPGAVLVTPVSGAAGVSYTNAEGDAVVSGFVENAFSRPSNLPEVRARFKISNSELTRFRSAYEEYSANLFFSEAATRLGISRTQRLPQDSGYLGISGIDSLRLNGGVTTSHPVSGRGAYVDVSTASSIVLGKDGAPSLGTSFLDVGVLSSWGAESLLVGGLRERSAEETTIEVRTPSIMIEAGSSPLSGSEIILAAEDRIIVGAGASIISTGGLSESADMLELSGNGAFLRVSGDSQAAFSRSGRTTLSSARLEVGQGALISGEQVTLDSSASLQIDPGTLLTASSLYLGSGRIRIVLDPSLPMESGAGGDMPLDIRGGFLSRISTVEQLSLRSYTTIDIAGSGEFGSASLGSLNLLSAGLRGSGVAASATIRAKNVRFDNSGMASPLSLPTSALGMLTVISEEAHLGSNSFRIDGFRDASISATHGVVAEGSGILAAGGNIMITTPEIVGLQGAKYAVNAMGEISLLASGTLSQVEAGLGARFAFLGSSLEVNTLINLPSGEISLRARDGDLSIGGSLFAAGGSQTFFDIVRYSNAGRIILMSDNGNVLLNSQSRVQLDASGPGKAGTLAVNAPNGSFMGAGLITAKASSRDDSGSFVMDVGFEGNYRALNSTLQKGGFFASRSIRIRSGNVVLDTLATAREFVLSADQGSITVAPSGVIDASGQTGGRIALAANGDVRLLPGAFLSVKGTEFASNGKGGSISLEAGTSFLGVPGSGIIDLQNGAVMDLFVESFVAGSYTAPGSSAFDGKFTGTLHLRAPQTDYGLQINPILSTILDASSIVVEGYRIYDLTGTDGIVTPALQATIRSDAANLFGTLPADASAADPAWQKHSDISAFLLAGDPQGLEPSLVIAPGAEIINRSGDLLVGSGTAGATEDWDLSGFRFGPKSAAGVLTLRASGNLVFNNALSDGFSGDYSPDVSPEPGQELWLRPLMDINPLLPVNTQSWSYRLTSGADMTAADFRTVQSLAQSASGSGSVLVGRFLPISLVSGSDATTADAIKDHFQVIRTGAGDIEVSAARDVQLRNTFSTIYTAGVRLPYSNTISSGSDVRYMSIYGDSDFSVPLVELGFEHPSQGDLGQKQQDYPAQYAMAGGDLRIFAQQDIGRFTEVSGVVVADTSRQMPSNWLYRRGYIDQDSGLFGSGGVSGISDISASTTWWVDYSNYFQGFGALGGGDVAIRAGRDVINADAVTPTNARMAGLVWNNDGTHSNTAPDESKMIELGGGDISIIAGNNISGGTFYVERGLGNLSAAGEILTNSARSPSSGHFESSSQPSEIVESITPAIYDSRTWLPTTLFVGKSRFDVTASGDILLGPVTNAFLLPQGLNNKFWYKTYFQTYSEDAGVTVTSFGGSVTHRLAATLPGDTNATPILQTWISSHNLLNSQSTAFYEPWTRLAEADIASFQKVSTLMAPNLVSTAFAGDINLLGNMNLFPSASGTLELVASGGVIGLQPSGKTFTQSGSVSVAVTAWTPASINLSDSNPATFPGVLSPLAYQSIVGSDALDLRQTLVNPFINIDPALRDTGSYTGEAGSIESKRALHSTSLLHADDMNPVRIYATGGDVTALALFTPKATRIAASMDITDVAFYIQNLKPSDISLVSAGRDIIPFNENSRLRSIASDIARGNVVVPSALDKSRATVTGITNISLEGDLQIAGPGVLEVLAGRDIDLGTGANLADGTGIGITSIGNYRNPFLPLSGSDLIVLAGVSGGDAMPALGLSSSSLDFDAFLSAYSADVNLLESPYLEKISLSGGFDSATPEQQAIVAMEQLFTILRDTGRASLETGSYETGFAAIDTLFGSITSSTGDILTRARDIRTATGGSIVIAAPSGGLTMASDIFGNPLTPPGIVTEYGGALSIFTDQSVGIGQARIFTLRGGDILMWSSKGDIAAGTASKTVVTAPPTRVVFDSTSAAVETDLGGLATGGGIGVLAAVRGVEPGDVDLIAPTGVVDAGDAGIRSTGNLNIAATAVLNAGNISAGGSTSGVASSAPIAAPNIGGLTSGSSSTSAASTAAQNVANQAQSSQPAADLVPSIITVEILGYGGGDSDEG